MYIHLHFSMTLQIKSLLYIINQSSQNTLLYYFLTVACIFEEYKYFLKFFKYNEKMTPTEFRNIYTKTHTMS